MVERCQLHTGVHARHSAVAASPLHVTYADDHLYLSLYRKYIIPYMHAEPF
jgi:hypothetical protein